MVCFIRQHPVISSILFVFSCFILVIVALWVGKKSGILEFSLRKQEKEMCESMRELEDEIEKMDGMEILQEIRMLRIVLLKIFDKSKIDSFVLSSFIYSIAVSSVFYVARDNGSLTFGVLSIVGLFVVLWIVVQVCTTYENVRRRKIYERLCNLEYVMAKREINQKVAFKESLLSNEDSILEVKRAHSKKD